MGSVSTRTTGYGPRVSKTDTAIAATLALAGLQFIERITTEVHPPLPPYSSCQPPADRGEVGVGQAEEGVDTVE